jgi:hypothetical protein
MDQFGCGVVGPCLSIVLPLLVIDGVWFFSLAFGLGFFATVVHASQVVGSAILSTVKSGLVLVIDVWFFSLAFGLGFFATVEVVGNAILSTVKSVLSTCSRCFRSNSNLKPHSTSRLWPAHHSDLDLESGPTYNGMLQPSQGGTERI